MNNKINTMDKAAARRDMVATLQKKYREEVMAYGTVDSQLQSITKLLGGLVERYDHQFNEHYECTGERLHGDWFGLQAVEFETLDIHARLFRTAYRMNDDLCDVLEVPHGTQCYSVSVNRKIISRYIPGFNHSVRELDCIRRLLESVIPIMLMKTGTGE